MSSWHEEDGVETIGAGDMSNLFPVTLFDFDCCGVGWRAYDLAVFRWAARLRKMEAEQWPAFLRGCRETRTIREIDIQPIPYFVALRHVRLMSMHAASQQNLGEGG